jgi:uncharacterized membrane protein YraQ (UPF0718 family)
MTIAPMRLPKVDRTTAFLILIALILAAIAWMRGGSSLAVRGIQLGGETLLRVTPILIAAFLVAGLTQVLVSKEMVKRWLSASSGWRGILIACIAGALVPGGPYVYYPIAGSLLTSGAGLGVLVAFITAKNLWSISRLPYEFALLGSELTITRYLFTLIVPPLLGFLVEGLFGRFIDTIRAAVQ